MKNVIQFKANWLYNNQLTEEENKVLETVEVQTSTERSAENRFLCMSFSKCSYGYDSSREIIHR